jgi:acyl-CoA synthetase (AMP-forming)/AMP-acid ligase II
MLAETPTTESTLEASEKKINTAKSIASTKALLKDICQQHLPKYWQPRDYIFTDKIPTTETGKPARSKAEELAGKEM